MDSIRNVRIYQQNGIVMLHFETDSCTHDLPLVALLDEIFSSEEANGKAKSIYMAIRPMLLGAIRWPII
jgi:hypothetical protein